MDLLFIQIKNGNAEGIINTYKEEINIDVTPKIAENELKTLVVNSENCKETDIIEIKPIVYQLEDNNFILAHECVINAGIGNKKIIINDSTKEVISRILPFNCIDENDIDELYVNGRYELKAPGLNIFVYRATADLEVGKVPQLELYTWNNKEDAKTAENQLGIKTLNHTINVYNYYNEIFNHKYFDNKEDSEIHIITGVNRIIGYEDPLVKNAVNAGNMITFSADNTYNDNFEVIAHECTHGVFSCEVGDIAEKEYEAMALNEAYADIMAMCAETYYNPNSDKIDGHISGVNRDIKNSRNKYKENKKDKGLVKEEHADSTIISRAAYRINESLNIKEFEKLWYESIKLLPENPNFYDCEYALLVVAEQMNISTDIIKNAFKEVGIERWDNSELNEIVLADKKVTEEIKNAVDKEKNKGIALNSELNGVYAFANKTDGNSNSSIVALKDGNSEVQILNIGTTNYECLDYSYGKLYLQKEKEFFYIDLTKGNGSYIVESFYKVESVGDWQEKRMQVYDNELYFNKGGQQLIRYNIETKTEEIIETVYSRGDAVDFRIDKEDGILYYCKSMARDGISVFGTYKIETKEKKEIYTEDRNGGKGYQILLGNLTNSGVVVYKFSNYEGTIGFEYNRFSNELVKIADGDLVWNRELSDGNRLYYTEMKSEEVLVTYTLKAKENEEIKDVLATGEDSINKIYNLNDKQIQVITGGGQDISTYHTKTFLIDKETLESTQVNTTYNVVTHIMKGSDTNSNKKTVTSNNINNFSNDILVGKWKAMNTNSAEYSLGYLFGSSISMNNVLEFKQDGTYTLGIGFSYNETGNYEIQGDTIKLTNIKYEGDSPDVTPRTNAEFKIKQENGTNKIILEHKQDEYISGKGMETLTIEISFEKNN